MGKLLLGAQIAVCLVVLLKSDVTTLPRKNLNGIVACSPNPTSRSHSQVKPTTSQWIFVDKDSSVANLPPLCSTLSSLDYQENFLQRS